MAAQKKNPNVLTLNIETGLINKEETFRLLGLAHATGLPILLIGPPGTGKTKIVLEYAKAWLKANSSSDKEMEDNFMEKVYILETDEGTKASEVKGIPDMKKLFVDSEYEIVAPIAEAEVVIINEVDKASSAIRNALLGVMNEKFLFNGKQKIPCAWKLFVATCNEIPKDEIASPFWDRFMLKSPVQRITSTEMNNYYTRGAKKYKNNINVDIPDENALDKMDIKPVKLGKFLDVAYSKLSDRTLTFVPSLAKAAIYVWKTNVDSALIKIASIMINMQAASDLQNKLVSPDMKAVMSRIETLFTCSTKAAVLTKLAELEALLESYAKSKKLDKDQVDEASDRISQILSEHKVQIVEEDITKWKEAAQQKEAEILSQSF